PRCIEWITSIHTLHPGDILATGTNHRGLNPFMDGDNIELTCEGCGTLHIAVRDDLKRTWARITRLQHKQSGAEGAHTKQTGGKSAPTKCLSSLAFFRIWLIQQDHPSQLKANRHYR